MRLLRQFLILICYIPVLFADVIYVDHEAQPGGDGSSWSNALDSIDSLKSDNININANTEVWVKKGLYIINDRAALTIAGGSIIGGFNGDESDKSERVYEADQTIIESNLVPIDWDGQEIVIFEPIVTAYVEGFSLRGLRIVPDVYNDGSRYARHQNAGFIKVRNEDQEIVFKNCIFEENDVLFRMYGLPKRKLVFANCIFRNNNWLIFDLTGQNVEIECYNSVFHDNYSPEIALIFRSLTNTNTFTAFNTLITNNSQLYGVAFGVGGDHVGNSLFYEGTINLTNCTIINNFAGAAFSTLAKAWPSDSLALVINNTTFNNFGYNQGQFGTSVNYSLSEHDYINYSNNSSLDQLKAQFFVFDYPLGLDRQILTNDDGFNPVNQYSDLVDAGDPMTPYFLPFDNYDVDNDGVTNEFIDVDIFGNQRISGDNIDIGAVEFSSINDEFSDIDSDGIADFIEVIFGFNASDPTDGQAIRSFFQSNDFSNSLSLSEIQDLRPGSTMIEVSGNQATVQLQMEESSDLQTWEDTGTPATMTIPADTDTKFFRFKMAE